MLRQQYLVRMERIAVSRDISDAVQSTVRDTLVKFAPSPLVSVTRQTELVAELGYHSLALLEVIFALEDELGIELVDDGTAGQISTVGDVEEYVAKIMEYEVDGEAGASQQSAPSGKVS